MGIFRTKLDFSDNRQVKQRIETTTNLSGATTFGVPFSDLPTGPNPVLSSITQTFSSISSTFSGNNTTTIFTWGDANMAIAEAAFSAITPSTSAITQDSGYVFVPDFSSYFNIDGNTGYTQYTGVSYDIQITDMADLGGGNYTGDVSTTVLEYVTTNGLDFTGRTIWADVSGITRTNRLIITDNPMSGYVWTCINSEGMGEWQYNGSSSGSTIWTAGTGINSAVLGGSNGIASGSTSVSEGNNTIAGGIASHAEGNQTLASGYAAHSEGMNTIASGNYSHAEGYGDSNGFPTASGVASHAEGNATLASGVFSHAQGRLTVASGQSSHAGGSNSKVYSNRGFIHSYFSDIKLNSEDSAILGGFNNKIDNSKYSGIFVGFSNIISGGTSGNTYNMILGGNDNLINNHANSFIIGGSGNTIHFDLDDIAVTNNFESIINSRDCSISASTNVEINNSVGVSIGDNILSSIRNSYAVNFNEITGNYTTDNSSGLNLIDTSIDAIINGYTTGNAIISSSNARILGTYSGGNSFNNVIIGSGSIYLGAMPGNIFENTKTTTLGCDSIFYEKSNYVFIGASSDIYSYTGDYLTILGTRNSGIEMGTFSTILGGRDQTLTNVNYSTILGGRENTILTSDNSGVFVGRGNVISGITDTSGSTSGSTIIGGSNNLISNQTVWSGLGSLDGIGESTNSSIIGGTNNSIYGHKNSAIIGGTGNTIHFDSPIGYNNSESIITSFDCGITASTNSSILSSSGSSIVFTDKSSIIGGYENNLTQSFNSIILGGYNNNGGQGFYDSDNISIIGGRGNNITGGSFNSSIISSIDSEIELGDGTSIIGGSGNTVTSGSFDVILGGQDSLITSSNYSGIFAGLNNQIGLSEAGFSANAQAAVILGGNSNIIYEALASSSILGGSYNEIHKYTDNASIVGGAYNSISGNSESSGVFAGSGNTITNASNYSSIIGGKDNLIDGHEYAAIIGGYSNTIHFDLEGTEPKIGETILGGYSNTISASSHSTILGGSFNEITNYDSSGILGGTRNKLIDINIDTWPGPVDFNSNANYETKYSTIIGGVDNSMIGKVSHGSILGGSGNTINGNIATTTNYDSAIVGGRRNIINELVNRSVILGGGDITATTSDMVYVPDLVIDGLISASPLETDANGKIIDGASDARLKQNVNILTNSLNTIKNLRGVSFEYTPESNMGGGVRYGFIAQEVQQHVPNIVRNRAKGDGMLSLNYNEIVPILVEAVKELSSGVTTSNNTHLETQTILAEDNNIELNFNGTQQTSLGGGLVVLHAKGQDESANLITDADGNFVTNNDFKPQALTIPLYTPTSSNDEAGSEGNITRDDNYMYVKTSTGWKRTNLENF